MTIQVFWRVTLCCWVSGYQCFKRLWCLHLQGSSTLLRRTRYVSSKCWETFIQWHSVTSQKTWTLGKLAVSGFCDKLRHMLQLCWITGKQPGYSKLLQQKIHEDHGLCAPDLSALVVSHLLNVPSSSWPMRTGYCYTGPLLYSKNTICHFLPLFHCTCAQLAEWTMLMQ